MKNVHSYCFTLKQSRRLWGSQISRQSAHTDKCGKVVSPKYRPPLPPRKWTRDRPVSEVTTCVTYNIDKRHDIHASCDSLLTIDNLYIPVHLYIDMFYILLVYNPLGSIEHEINWIELNWIEVQTRNPSTCLCLRPRGHWDRAVVSCAVPVRNVWWTLFQEGRSSKFSLSLGVGQAAHTHNNPHVKFTAVYCE